MYSARSAKFKRKHIVSAIEIHARKHKQAASIQWRGTVEFNISETEEEHGPLDVA